MYHARKNSGGVSAPPYFIFLDDIIMHDKVSYHA